jgi:ATP-dependent DNA helicase RecG
MGFIEEMGFGMDVLKSLHLKYGLPLPEYSYEDPFLILTLPRSYETVKNAIPSNGMNKLSQEERRGYEFIKVNASVKRKQYEDFFKIDKKKAERQLSKMVEEGLINRKGSGPGTYYEVNAT